MDVEQAKYERRKAAGDNSGYGLGVPPKLTKVDMMVAYGIENNIAPEAMAEYILKQPTNTKESNEE